MKNNQIEDGRSSDPITKKAVELAGAVAERSHMNKELLIALATAVGTNERAQRRFRYAVLAKLSGIEATLTEIQGAQLVQYWPPGKVSDEQRTKWIQEVQERVSKAGHDMGLKMVKYICGEGEEPEGPGALRGGRRKWSGWEI